MDIMTLLFVGLSALATIGAGVIAWRMLRTQTEPAFSMHLESGSNISLLNLVIQNYGLAPAFDLRWEVSPPVEELEKYGSRLHRLELLNGFEHMAPKQRIVTYFGNAIELIARKCPPIRITVRYRNGGEEAGSDTYVLNPCQFAGITDPGPTPEERMAKALESIKEQLHDVERSSHIRVSSLEERPWLANVGRLFKLIESDLPKQPLASDSRVNEIVEPASATGAPGIDGDP